MNTARQDFYQDLVDYEEVIEISQAIHAVESQIGRLETFKRNTEIKAWSARAMTLAARGFYWGEVSKNRDGKGKHIAAEKLALAEEKRAKAEELAVASEANLSAAKADSLDKQLASLKQMLRNKQAKKRKDQGQENFFQVLIAERISIAAKHYKDQSGDRRTQEEIEDQLICLWQKDQKTVSTWLDFWSRPGYLNSGPRLPCSL